MGARIGFVGLGTMGMPMSGNLMAAGYSVAGYDLRVEQKDQFEKNGGSFCDSPLAVADFASVVIFSLPFFHDVKRITGEIRSVLGQKREAVIIDMGTSPPAGTQELAAGLKEEGITLLDAPVSGGPGRARSGELSIFIGGCKDTYEKHIPIFTTVGKQVFYMGESGKGQVMKLVNNSISSINMIILAEALALGAKAGLPLDKMVDVINVSGGTSRISQERGPRIANRDFSPAASADIIYKDLLLASNFSHDVYSPLPLVNAGLQLYQLASAKGLGQEDICTIFKVYEALGNKQKAY